MKGGSPGTGAPRSDFLAEMAADARRRVAAARERRPLARPAPAGRPGRLRAALAAATLAPPDGPATSGRLGLIAEVKRRSPSKGDLAPALDAATHARAYEAAGADAVSVLTQPSHFGGSLDDLRAVGAAVRLPVLRKDFIVDRYQVWEAADGGAAAVLLLVAMLDDAALHDLSAECAACGLDALVEVHDEDDLRRAADAGAVLIGINNRDLHTLTVSLEATARLAALAPAGALLVSESGIGSPADARRVAGAGASAVLVGEALVRGPQVALPTLVGALRDPFAGAVRP